MALLRHAVWFLNSLYHIILFVYSCCFYIRFSVLLKNIHFLQNKREFSFELLPNLIEGNSSSLLPSNRIKTCYNRNAIVMLFLFYSLHESERKINFIIWKFLNTRLIRLKKSNSQETTKLRPFSFFCLLLRKIFPCFWRFWCFAIFKLFNHCCHECYDENFWQKKIFLNVIWNCQNLMIIVTDS